MGTTIIIVPSVGPIQKVISKEVYLPFLNCRSYQYLIYIYVIWSLYCEYDGICDIFCLQRLHQLCHFNIFFQCLVGYSVYKFCRHYSWLNTRNPYVRPLAELLSKTFAERCNGVLCRTVDAPSGINNSSSYRRNIDYVSRLLVQHRCNYCSSAVKHSPDVDIDHFVPLLNLEILEKAQGLETSIVNKDIDGTPLFHDSISECVTFGLYCDVQFLNENVSSIFDDLALQRF